MGRKIAKENQDNCDMTSMSRMRNHNPRLKNGIVKTGWMKDCMDNTIDERIQLTLAFQCSIIQIVVDVYPAQCPT